MKKGGCLGRIVTLVVAAAALWITSYVLPGFQVAAFWPDAVIAALVIGALNSVVKPVLVLLTLPATILTLGIFLLVINAGMLLAADHFLAGLMIDGWLTAAIASLLLSVCTAVLEGLVFKGDDE